MKNTLSKQLADNLSYYIGQDTRCKNGAGCFYSGEFAKKPEVDGCFVGRLISPENRVKIDEWVDEEGTDSGVREIIKNQYKIGIELPSIITHNVDMMEEFQSLHDNDFNWYKGQLTEGGKSNLKKIIETYKLNLEYFSTILNS